MPKIPATDPFLDAMLGSSSPQARLNAASALSVNAEEFTPTPTKPRSRNRGGKLRQDEPVMVWSNAAFAGLRNSPRSCHSSTCVGDLMVVFGGHSGGKYFNSVEVLDTSTMTWLTGVPSGRAPSVRYAHTAVRIGEQVYIFGGFGEGGTYLDDLHVLDTRGGKLVWSQPAVSGDAPCARAAAAAAVVGSVLYLFGGNQGEHRLNEVHALDTETMHWRLLEPDGPRPRERAGHTMVELNSELVVFGGGDSSPDEDVNVFGDIAVLDPESGYEGSWRIPSVCGQAPSPRAGCAAASLGGLLYIVGGGNGLRFVNDVHVLDTASMAWSVCKTGGAIPSSRAGQSLCKRDSMLYLYGGANAKTVFSDLSVLNTAGSARSKRRAGAVAGGGAAPVVPGLERKLRSRSKKEELLQRNILKQNRGGAAFQASQDKLVKARVGTSLSKHLALRPDEEQLRQAHILVEQNLKGRVGASLGKFLEQRPKEEVLREAKILEEAQEEAAFASGNYTGEGGAVALVQMCDLVSSRFSLLRESVTAQERARQAQLALVTGRLSELSEQWKAESEQTERQIIAEENRIRAALMGFT